MTNYEPTSSAHREALYAAPPKPEPPPAPPKRSPLAKPQPPDRRRRPRVRVEGATTPREQALTKKLTSTEALSSDERALLREMRSLNPNAAGIVLRKLKAKEKKK